MASYGFHILIEPDCVVSAWTTISASARYLYLFTFWLKKKGKNFWTLNPLYDKELFIFFPFLFFPRCYHLEGRSQNCLIWPTRWGLTWASLIEGGAYALAANGGRHWVQVFAPLWTGFGIGVLPVVVTRAFWRRESGRESSTRRKPVVFMLDLAWKWIHPETITKKTGGWSDLRDSGLRILTTALNDTLIRRCLKQFYG